MNRVDEKSVVARPVPRLARRTPALTLVLALGLAACGQKGPLTLPKAPAGAASAPAGSGR